MTVVFCFPLSCPVEAIFVSEPRASRPSGVDATYFTAYRDAGNDAIAFCAPETRKAIPPGTADLRQGAYIVLLQRNAKISLH